jgi:MGT family glycosyltransferase
VAPPELVDDPPPNFVVRPSVPFLALLERVDAVVCHGGQNTVNEALAHALPLVVAPLAFGSGWAVARQVVGAGAGVRVRAVRLTARELREAVATVLAEPRYRQAAQRVQASFRAAGGAGAAADELELLGEAEAG